MARNGYAGGAGGGAVYGLGLIGALVYYVQAATSFWTGSMVSFEQWSGRRFWCTGRCTLSSCSDRAPAWSVLSSAPVSTETPL